LEGETWLTFLTQKIKRPVSRQVCVSVEEASKKLASQYTAEGTFDATAAFFRVKIVRLKLGNHSQI